MKWVHSTQQVQDAVANISKRDEPMTPGSVSLILSDMAATIEMAIGKFDMFAIPRDHVLACEATREDCETFATEILEAKVRKYMFRVAPRLVAFPDVIIEMRVEDRHHGVRGMKTASRKDGVLVFSDTDYYYPGGK